MNIQITKKSNTNNYKTHFLRKLEDIFVSNQLIDESGLSKFRKSSAQDVIHLLNLYQQKLEENATFEIKVG